MSDPARGIAYPWKERLNSRQTLIDQVPSRQEKECSRRYLEGKCKITGQPGSEQVSTIRQINRRWFQTVDSHAHLLPGSQVNQRCLEAQRVSLIERQATGYEFVDRRLGRITEQVCGRRTHKLQH
jgi:hypothetical protein